MGGGSKKGLFYSIIRDNSPEMASACMLRLSKFSARWISSWGLSIGISDVTPSNSFLVKKKAFIDDGRSESQKLIELYEKGTLPLKPGCNIE
jgi:DNA-directed RNA polymerase III subunit RPC1